MARVSTFLLDIKLLFLVAACASNPDETGHEPLASVCEPGATFECSCGLGRSGMQACDDTGTALVGCECEDTGGGDVPQPGTGGAAQMAGGAGVNPTIGSGGVPPSTGSGGMPADGGAGTASDPGAGMPEEGAGTAPDPGGGLSADAGASVAPDGDAGAPADGMAPDTGVGGAPAQTPNATGTCCSAGDCLCHGPDPTALTSSAGPFDTDSYRISTGVVHFPTDADPPFAAIALCGGFLNTGPEMEAWGPFYASHGIVTVITTTTGADLPDIRAAKLLAAIDELKTENMSSESLLFGKLAGRYGTSGYSMGGGGTTIASTSDPSLRTSVGLAAWAPVGSDIQVPTLLLCGSSDTVAPCSQSDGSYGAIPESTPKMMVEISRATHLNWFGPTDAGGGISGETALAFQKVFLEGDERWKPLLLQSGGAQTTNIN